MSLVCWLPLNGDLHNQGANGANPILMGTGITWSAGKIGQAATFPNNCNSCIHMPGLRLQTGSIAAWILVKGSGGATRQCIISEGRDSYNDGVEIWASQAGTTINFKAHEKVLSATITLNTWYHIVGTFGNGEVKLYLNGQAYGTPQMYTADMTYQYASDLTLGKMSYSYTSTGNYFPFNGQLNDVRIYNHCLSAAEVREISQGLVLHYKLDNINNGIQDSSGYNHNAISNGSQSISIDSDTPKYSYSTKFISGSRIAMPVASSTCLPTNAITVSIWYKSSAGTTRFLSCTEGGGWNFEVSSSKASFPFYIRGKGYGRITSTKNFYSDNQWHMITVTYDGINTGKWYWDGVLDNTITITSGWENLPIAYNTNTPLTLGAEAQTIASPIAGTYVGNLSDLRIYCTALDVDAVRQLYEVGAKIDNKQNLHTFELIETNKQEITKQGQTKGQNLLETYLPLYDKNIYTEPDGSTWIHIFHHNNPAASKFNEPTLDWTTGKYLDADRWYDVDQAMYHTLSPYELMVKQKTTNTATETKYRWIQTANPLTATWADVKPGTVTFNTSSGYTNSSYGGMYLFKNTNLHMCIANGSNGNWYGGIGAAAAYNSGIPGFPNTTVTSGYIDLYMRVYVGVKIIKGIGINSSEFIEL